MKLARTLLASALFTMPIPAPAIAVTAVATVVVAVQVADEPEADASTYDCHDFRAYDGAGRYQATTLCYALPPRVYVEARLFCYTGGGGTVTLYGPPVGNAYPSRTGWHSGACSASHVFY